MTAKLGIVICACALAIGLVPVAAASAADGGGTAATTVKAKADVPAAPRYRTAYKKWRARLHHPRVYVGRNLLKRGRGEVVAAGATTVTKSELRHSIHRMQRRWSRWLRHNPRGQVVAYQLKVRDHVPGWGKSHLRSIAWCESKNDPTAIGGGGAYRGMYQFSFSTWAVVGGSGDPAAASRWEQTWRAWLLLSRHGSGHWPICG
jgi:hypothetical protein